MSRPLILLSEALPCDWLEDLSEHCELHVDPETLPPARNTEVKGLLSMLSFKVDRAVLDRYPAMKVVANFAVGFDNIDLDHCRERSIAVGNTPGVLTDATADLAMALLLASARRLPEAAADARDGKWPAWMPARWLGHHLSGATLGIVGMGKIGQATARRARAFGMDILYCSRSVKAEADAELGARRVSLDTLLSESDFLSLHTPLTPETHHLLGAEQFERMKPTAHVINTARGKVIDQQALVHALQSGSIAAAALDVTDPEPLPSGHPLYARPNCLILPHIGSGDRKTRKKMAHMAGENILAGLRSEPLPYSVL